MICIVVNLTPTTRSLSSKAVFPDVMGNHQVRSGIRIDMSDPSHRDKCLIATSGTANVNELDTSFWLLHDHLVITVSTRFLDSVCIAGDTLLLTTQGQNCNRSYMKQEPNPDRGIYKNSGLPKGGNANGNGVPIVVKSSNLCSSCDFYHYILTKHEVEQPFKAKLCPFIIDKSERVLYFAPIDLSKVIHIIGHPKTLQLAYELIKSKPGNMSPGADGKTLDGMCKS